MPELKNTKSVMNKEQLDRIEMLLEMIILKDITPNNSTSAEIIAKQTELRRKVRLACGQNE